MIDHRLEFFELVLKPCSRTYGTAPCTAAIGVTGAYKCYNSPATCQDPANFLAGEQVIRWAVPTEDLPVDYDYIPSVQNISVRAQKIEPAESLGTRESLSASFCNHRHNDIGFDKYLSDRTFNPFNTGTFWGKFAARWPNIQGCECRYIRGFVGQTLAEMEHRYYIVESTSGPDNAGHYSISAKDAIKFLDGDKAQAPLASLGVLLNDITDVATALTLSPAGVGDLHYPASGIASMGDEEVSFTRSADAITLTGRGLSGSKLGEHKKDETFQLAIVYVGAKTSQIIYDLISGYSDTPSEYLDLTAWDTEDVQRIGRLYSGKIMKPTPVKKIIDELVQQVGLVIYTDTKNKKIVFKAMRNLVPVMSLSDDTVLAGTLTAKIESNKRLTQVLMYYAQKNALEKQDDDKNYFAILNSFAGDAVAALEQASEAIKKIYSRWISIFNRPAAEAVNTYVLKRYKRAPWSVAFKLPYTIPLELGSVFTMQSIKFEDPQGDMVSSIPFQALSVEVTESGCTVLGEQIPPAEQNVDDGVAIVDIDTSSLNLNLRAIYDTIYLPPVAGDVVKFICQDGINIGSTSNAQFAVVVGDWPAGVIVELHGGVTIAGWAGRGSIGVSGDEPVVVGFGGMDGGGALYARFPIKIYAGAKIWSGGGGGAGGIQDFGGGGTPSTHIGGEGGGSFGLIVKEFGTAGSPYYPAGGAGGDVGSGGADFWSIQGGAAGIAIDGVSYVTFDVPLDVRGAQVN